MTTLGDGVNVKVKMTLCGCWVSLDHSLMKLYTKYHQYIFNTL